MRKRDESGAIAVVVAVLTLALMGMSAFVVDVGAAYANKRQLQTSADAAALGAAGVFAEQQFRQCADIRLNGLTAATVEAESKVVAHRSSLSPGVLTSFTALCESGDLVVRTTVSATSPNIFGRVVGSGNDYNIVRSAAAVVEAGNTAPRLRPMALCAADLPAATVPGTAFRLFAPGNGGAAPGSCPIPPNPGNWWTLDCPVESGGTAALEDQIRNGCSTPIEIIPLQGALTGAALNSHLASRCPTVATAPSMCLSGDPGQPDSGHIEDAWRDLIDQELTVPIPVFCAPSPGICATSSVTGTGTNAIFPVHKLIAVQICGYHFGKQNTRKYVNNSLAGCSGYSAETGSLMGDNSDDVYLLMIARNLQVSNVTADSTCQLGLSCDGGLRQVRMVSGGFSY
ncbi:pilus assembly protein TadG-related protein [Nocardioides sp.]|uniref:pilus assembly protein TadG-related protein n=1 Tax=Nocardioides sp. TaxID=35761 RepID=UPI002C8E4DE6|nr:pilus assembly protein TadG-related protein [Nocardioides sp.]HXH77993.1 pilus assembly protein TadG-related protein [Nocardioides sp.]